MGGEGVVDAYDAKGDKDGLDKAFQGGFEDAEWAEGWGRISRVYRVCSVYG